MERSPQPLNPREVFTAVQSLHEAGAINLDTPLNRLIEPIISAVGDPRGTGDLVSLHVLCCNEYALVTGLTSGPDVQRTTPVSDVGRFAESIRRDVEPL